jgi:hypothetical protein
VRWAIERERSRRGKVWQSKQIGRGSKRGRNGTMWRNGETEVRSARQSNKVRWREWEAGAAGAQRANEIQVRWENKGCRSKGLYGWNHEDNWVLEYSRRSSILRSAIQDHTFTNTYLVVYSFLLALCTRFCWCSYSTALYSFPLVFLFCCSVQFLLLLRIQVVARVDT